MLERIHRGELQLVARDTPEPSSFAHEILNARPYAFLDDAPLEERRAQAVQTRRAGEPSSARELGALDPAAIERVRDEARPDPRDADELHDALLTSGFLTRRRRRIASARSCSTRLREQRACGAHRSACGQRIWVAAERLPEILAIHPDAVLDAGDRSRRRRAMRAWTREEALVELLRGRTDDPRPDDRRRRWRRRLAFAESDADAALSRSKPKASSCAARFKPVAGDAARVVRSRGCSRASTATR